MRRPRLWLPLTIAGILLIACGGGTGSAPTPSLSASASAGTSPTSSPFPSPSPSPECTSGDDTSLEITAKGHLFDTDCLAAAAGKALSIEFHNEDADTHNVAILDHPGGTAIFTGKIFVGPKTMTYHVDPLEAGEYYFRCDVHPLAMNGTLVVSG